MIICQILDTIGMIKLNWPELLNALCGELIQKLIQT